MLDVYCPVCGTKVKVGDSDKPCVDPRTVDGKAFLIPEVIGKETVTENEIWELAQIRAKEKFEESGVSWETNDKYQKEDLVFAEYSKLKGDDKGETKMSGEKKMTKKEQRFEALRAAGFDVDAMIKSGFDLSAFIKKDEIVDEIYENGYVRQSRLYRRFITAEYIGLLGWFDGALKKDTWTENFNKKYAYQYQFDYTKKELKALSVLENSDEEAFNERKQFFSKEVIIKLCENYIEELQQSLKKYKVHKCKKVPYIKYHGVNIFVEDEHKYIINPLSYAVSRMKSCNSYRELANYFNSFTKSYGYKDGRRYAIFTKLKPDTKKCPEWVDAFKGAGAYFSALNVIRFSGCCVHQNDKVLDKYQSESLLKDVTKEYSGEWWRLHAFVKKMLKDNNFNLREVIENK